MQGFMVFLAHPIPHLPDTNYSPIQSSYHRSVKVDPRREFVCIEKLHTYLEPLIAVIFSNEDSPQRL